MAKLHFKDADDVKETLMSSQKKEISKLYNDWANEIAKKAEYYSHKTNSSAGLSQRYYQELQNSLRETSKQVTNKIYDKIKNNVYTTSDAVVKNNVKWLNSLGFDDKVLGASFSSVPEGVVQRLLNGQIYKEGWSLSAKLWSDNEDTLRDIYKIMAQGMAENLPIYDIAKNLEKYVRPNAKLPWNLTAPDGVKIYKKKVDYVAQRLARTLVQHGYQQSLIDTTKKNPFVLEFIWNSNGPRVCKICADRDGVHYKKNDLPMDHPNGMCTIDVETDPKMIDKLANWFNEPDGTYPEIDNFAISLGYSPKPLLRPKSVQNFIDKYGHSNKSWGAWVQEAKKKGFINEAKALKDKEGLSWQKWYEKYIYSGNGSSTASKVAKTAKPKYNDDFLKKYGLTKKQVANFDTFYGDMSFDLFEKLTQEFGTPDDMAKWAKEIYEKHILANVPKSSGKFVGVATKKADDMPASFDDWLKMFENQSESVMLKKEAEWLKQLGSEAIDGIRMYSGSSYQKINTYLRYISQGFSEEDALKLSKINSYQLKALNDARNGLNKIKLDQDYIVRRGTDYGDLAGLFMQGDFDKNKLSLTMMMPDELNDMFQGAVGTYAGFTSTSSDYDKGFSGPVEVIIKVPKGGSAVSIMNISNFGTDEGELLLNAGTKVKCLSIKRSSPSHMQSAIQVFLEVIT